MGSIKLLQRSLRKSWGTNYFRSQRWSKRFSSTPSLLTNERKKFYPTDQIGNLEDFEKHASPEEKRLFQIVQSEYLALCRMGKLDMPDPTDSQWLNLMNLEGKRARERNFMYLQRIHWMKTKTPREKVTPEKNTHIRERFYKDMFSFTERTIINNRVGQAALLEDPILIDLGFADSLVFSEIIQVARQLFSLVECINRSAFEPTPTLNIMFCNAKPSLEDNEFLKVFRSKEYCGLDRTLKDLPVSAITEKSYLELFPREDLVYLSPDAKHYYIPEQDGIPIIGAIVDKTTKDKLSYSRAFEDNIKIRKLPIDIGETFYGSKRLALNHVVEYLAKLKFTGNPVEARTVLPHRKFINPEEKIRKRDRNVVI
ncbi:tRNA methyltransferase 10 homolog B-like [Saccostrea echinata]|uniref:tRNA methyltransferase 10 homolog B-like n=1 Tax=Saccostrea echinata TaxID=191078 RepID=UPI002A809192|nr:tRNA methyltransferase 10 homolog B-like [Saccostrea echinata]